MSSIVFAKKALRSTILEARKRIPPNERELQSREIALALTSCPEYQQSSSISCFLSIDGEVDTSSVIEDILKRGKRLFVPRVEKISGVMEMLRIYSLDDLSKLSPGVWGIREPGKISNTGDGPRENALNSTLDMIILPGVAFDSLGNRIGYGKGYYDRFIASYWSARKYKPELFGLAFKEQVVEPGTIPLEEHDESVQGVISPAFSGVLHRVASSDDADNKGTN
ncbi:5-formyltetrahydrofolate cyclo-ligase [Cantharellus anzutake]|uniref:5-formyltetrahydrofolate cyclo-ligase n=1 Tax=Cantharellus anzutake TaxID=1750568 RepID=UPI0019074F52|nr:5-formyltetrahydrofolate cyclo-ligase [Cantharellus anzutake]KAF8332010.1 5-formyltetrahydrofolate cyclo-ligase [Cantharellus anzutake]